jgi:CubicO group peptidase (beta-lactamase class C family)
MACLLAEQEKRLSIEAPSAIMLKDPTHSHGLSLKDILCHRVGLPAHDLLWYLSPHSCEELTAKLRYLDPIPGAFRKSFVYSNLMYASVAPNFENSVGQGLDSFIHEKILTPLGMDHTGFLLREPANLAVNNDALGYLDDQPMPRKEVESIFGAGGLRSNIEDLSRWLHFLLFESERGATSAKLLSKESHRKMQAAHNPVPSPDPLTLQGLEWLQSDSNHYSLGFFVGEVNGEKALYHPGLIDGFSVAIVLIPASQLAFAVLCNSNLNPFPGRLIEKLYAFVKGQNEPFTPQTPSSAISPMAHAANAKVPVPARTSPPVTGRFENPAYGPVEISNKVGETTLEYFQHRWPLRFKNEREALFELRAFGLPIPLSAQLLGPGGKPDELRVNFSMDARVGPQVFRRIS